MEHLLIRYPTKGKKRGKAPGKQTHTEKRLTPFGPAKDGKPGGYWRGKGG